MAKNIDDMFVRLGIDPNITVDELAHHEANPIDQSSQQNELLHYGVPGMRWGKRRSRSGSSSPKVTVKALSDDQLKSAISRMKLEQEFIKLATPPPSPGKKALQAMVAKVAAETAESYLRKGMLEGGDLVKTALNNRK